jgi:hypothetical protein
MSHVFPSGGKPLDFGFGGVMGCLNRSGRLTALNVYHPQHGVVTLTSAPPYPDADRYDAAKVRAYRRGLLAQAGIGLTFDAEPLTSSVDYAGDVPLLRLTWADGGSAECVTFTHPPHGVVQVWRFSAPREVRFTGTVWLQRNVYVQLTEGGPLPPVSPDTQTFACAAPDSVGLANPALPWAVCIAGMDHGIQAHANADGSVTLNAAARSATTFTLYYGLGQDAVSAQQAVTHLRALDHAMPEPQATQHGADPLEARAWRYTHLCSVPVSDRVSDRVSEESTCLLTDHMILPLSWNRDAYYAARLLLTDPQHFETVRRHLVWMFDTAERVNGLWGRSYLANGRVKDRGFQLDQQLFPLLELADYVQVTGDTGALERFKPQIAPLFDRLTAYRAPHALLFATDETPADDPIALPYPLSSHVLLWRVLDQLSALGCADLLPLTPDAVAASIQAHFVAVPETSAAPIYAYATDGRGQYHCYHDANDIPLVLMPVWGLCAPNDPLWQATIAFAFSPANTDGYYDPALGSVHTRAPWPLGDVQEWIVARLTGDVSRGQAVISRLQFAAQWDGALPEAYDATTGAVMSRNWFLWPSAAYACVKNGAFDR